MANKIDLHIRLFGNLSIQASNSEPTIVAPSRAGALLALLAIEWSHNRASPREEIVDALWPDDDAEDARHKLRQTLYDVRRQLEALKIAPDRVLIATRASLQLNPDTVAVDTALFETELCCASAESIPILRAERLECAIHIYVGELLPGFYQERFISEKTRLEGAYHAALKSLAAACEQTEQYDRGIATARKLVALDPLNEEAHFALMRLYAATGQPSQVLRQFQCLERTLKDELGEAPSLSAREMMASLREAALARAAALGAARFPSGLNPSRDDSLSPRVATIEPVFTEHFGGMDKPAYTHHVPGVLRRFRRSKATYAWAIAVLAAAAIALVSVHKHANLPTAASLPVKHVSAPGSHATVFARYKLAEDEVGSEPTALATDNVGDVYVAGFVQTRQHDADFITIKYDAKGAMLWRRRYDGPAHDVDRLRCIAVDAAGNVYVSGESENGSGTGSIGLSGLDVVTIKYSPAGKALWQDRFNDVDNGEDKPVKMLVDSAGNTYVLSACRRLRNGKDAGRDFVLIKYSPLGKRLWLRRYDSEAHDDDVPTGMALLYKDSGVCVCGYSKALYKTGPEYDYVTIEYSASGKCLWTKRYGAGNQADDYARDVSTDQDGNVFVAGEGRGLPGTPDEGRTGCIMVKYSPSGDMQWARGTSEESDRLQRVTASAFWSDGFMATAGSAVNSHGSTVYRIVLRDARGGLSRVFDTLCTYHPLANAPCALVIDPSDVFTHEAVWMVSSRGGTGFGAQVEFFVEQASNIDGMRWGQGLSPANCINSARAAVHYPKGIIVAGICTDMSGKGGMVLVRYIQ